MSSPAACASDALSRLCACVAIAALISIVSIVPWANQRSRVMPILHRGCAKPGHRKGFAGRVQRGRAGVPAPPA
ncbi:hypothetical protein GCM10009429_11450 [Dyella marensis]